MRTFRVTIFSALATLSATPAPAQQTAPANTPYIAPTGKTVPKPAELPNEGGVARDPKDRSQEEHKADKITGGICNGC